MQDHLTGVLFLIALLKLRFNIFNKDLIFKNVVNDRYCIVSVSCVINKNLIKMEMFDLR